MTMINLLPPSAKRNLSKEHKLRFAAVALIAIALLEIFAVFIFFPSYMTLRANIADLNAKLEQAKLLTPKEGDEVERTIAGIKKEIALLEPEKDSGLSLPSALFGEILRDKPAGITINAFAYAKAKDSIGVQLAGVAKTREDLLSFQRSIRDNPRVTDIKYGSSFITKKVDVDFTITVTFK